MSHTAFGFVKEQGLSYKEGMSQLITLKQPAGRERAGGCPAPRRKHAQLSSAAVTALGSGVSWLPSNFKNTRRGR